MYIYVVDFIFWINSVKKSFFKLILFINLRRRCRMAHTGLCWKLEYFMIFRYLFLLTSDKVF